MDCSAQDATSRLRKWHKEGSEVSCALLPSGTNFSHSPFIVYSRCLLDEVSDTLVVGFSKQAALRVPLRSVVKFECGTPADIKSVAPELLNYGSWLSIHLPGGMVLMLGERKDRST